MIGLLRAQIWTWKAVIGPLPPAYELLCSLKDLVLHTPDIGFRDTVQSNPAKMAATQPDNAYQKVPIPLRHITTDICS